jgi:hypothetical protein
MKILMDSIKVFKFHHDHYTLMKSDFPWSRGIIFTTSSLLELQNEFLTEHDYKSVFLGHFTQDGLEHLFSMIRSKIPDPTPSQAMACIKKIAMGRYMEEVPRASYEFTNGMFLLDFVPTQMQTINMKPLSLEILPLSVTHDVSLLVYIYGACVFSTIKIHLYSCTCKDYLM